MSTFDNNIISLSSIRDAEHFEYADVIDYRDVILRWTYYIPWFIIISITNLFNRIQEKISDWFGKIL